MGCRCSVTYPVWPEAGGRGSYGEGIFTLIGPHILSFFFLLYRFLNFTVLFAFMWLLKCGGQLVVA